MSKKKTLCLATAGAAAALLLAAAPARADGRIYRRAERQQQRIARGVASGELTPRETARLERGEARLHREVRHDRRDGGGLTPHERAKIERQQDRLSHRIYRQKHDRQARH
jgi:hypothetical protein